MDSDHPTGIYTFSDAYAVILLGVLAERRIRVPQDMALVSTDSLLLCEFL